MRKTIHFQYLTLSEIDVLWWDGTIFFSSCLKCAIMSKMTDLSYKRKLLFKMINFHRNNAILEDFGTVPSLEQERWTFNYISLRFIKNSVILEIFSSSILSFSVQRFLRGPVLIWRRLIHRGSTSSVHLASWPRGSVTCRRMATRERILPSPSLQHQARCHRAVLNVCGKYVCRGSA